MPPSAIMRAAEGGMGRCRTEKSKNRKTEKSKREDARGRQVMRVRGELLGGVLALLLLCGGCGVDFGYILPVVVGQIEIVLGSVPIPAAIRSGRHSEEQKAKLILIRDVRAYADEVIGLNTQNNYTTFYDSGGQPVAYNLSASAKDQLRPKIWSFPFVGSVPYLGFFDRPAAVVEYNELAALGYDAFMYPPDAYTSVQGIPNPVFSGMLERDEIHIVDLIFHELLHSTVWRQNDTTFNESMATFVGRTAMLEYFAARYPDRPERVEAARRRVEDTDRYNLFIFDLYAELEVFFAGDLSRRQKIEERDAVYQTGRERFMDEVQPLMHTPEDYAWVRDLPTNNAWMLANYRYTLDLDVFAQVHTATRADWHESLRVLRRAAKASDPFAFLRGWLADDAATLRELEHAGEPAAKTSAAERGPCSTRFCGPATRTTLKSR